MLRSLVPGLFEKISALAGTWLDHSAAQAPKLDHCGCQCCSKEGQLGGTLYCSEMGKKQQGGSDAEAWESQGLAGVYLEAMCGACC